MHRGLVRALGLGEGAEQPEDEDRLDTIAEDISRTERAAISAERDSQARMLAAYLENQEGATFMGRVSGVTRVGLFVALDETGADGFIPARTLGWERFEHDEARNAMVSEHDGRAYTLGMPVKVRLVEVTPIQGGLRFEMLTKPRAVGETAQEDKPLSRHERAKRTAKGAKFKKRKKHDRNERPGRQDAGDAKPPGKAREATSPKTAPQQSDSRRTEASSEKKPAGFKRRPRKKR